MNLDADFAAAYQHQLAGDLRAAEEAYRQLIAGDSAPAEVWYNLGLVLRGQGRPAEAIAAYERAVAANPRFPAAINNLGETLESLGRLDEAEDWYRHALLLQPDAAETWNNLGGVLKDLGRIDEGLACLSRACALQPANGRLHSNLVFARLFEPKQDAAMLRDAALAWGQRHADPLQPLCPTFANDPSPDRRLRIGYVSPYFREHCQALFTLPLFAHHRHDHFEFFGYCDHASPDATTAKLQGCLDGWRITASLDDAELAAQIQRDHIDVLADLTLHLAHHRLLTFARRPAPVQVSWLGYPGTTGVKAIDYRLTDPYLDASDAGDGFYPERVLRLPDTFWGYDPGSTEPAASPSRSPVAPFTFGCLNNFCKINDDVLALWGRILRAAPESRLLLLAPAGATRTRVKEKLGVAVGRVEFVNYQPRADYLRLYHRMDLGLDPFPYQGHTTSLDSLWMGVPMVSLIGSAPTARAALTFAAHLELSELTVTSTDQYEQLALALARNPVRLSALRGDLRQRMERSPLMDAPRFARAIEQAYRAAWSRWCAGGAR